MPGSNQLPVVPSQVLSQAGSARGIPANETPWPGHAAGRRGARGNGGEEQQRDQRDREGDDRSDASVLHCSDFLRTGGKSQPGAYVLVRTLLA